MHARIPLTALCVLLIAGCGGGEPTKQQGEQKAASEQSSADSQSASRGSGSRNSSPTTQAPRPLPTASIGASQANEKDPSSGKVQQVSKTKTSAPDLSEPPRAKDILQQIRELRHQSLEKSADAKTADVQELRRQRHQRNQKIVDLATEAIKLTHDDADRQQTFNTAVQELMEARLELALSGDSQAINALYEDAASLQQRDPDSVSAATGAFALARFAHTNARRFASREPRWLQEFARQARHFATHFPKETSRAVPLLYSAARSCELHGMLQQAKRCYEQIRQTFPETPQAEQAAAVLRRLNLPGEKLELGGPTFDGGFVSVEEHRGKVILIVFWASDNRRFLELQPRLTSLRSRYEESDFQIIGVNLDEQESRLKAFLDKHPVPGPQIFFSDRQKRRWDNPIVQHYGIREIPLIWLLDPQGKVVSTRLDPEELQGQIGKVLTDQDN